MTSLQFNVARLFSEWCKQVSWHGFTGLAQLCSTVLHNWAWCKHSTLVDIVLVHAYALK